ncbi:MAG: efflux RND transporter periplasmic adaptor subunit [Lachnospiraceae bacterium]|nr:efflux RND transporter periplasmic adaptor subunit [Lachnospiraceae bacterium]
MDKEMSKNKRKYKLQKKGIIIGLIILLVIIAVIGSYIIIQVTTKNEEKTEMMPPGMNFGGGEYVTAVGITTMGFTADTFDIDSLDTQLYVEDVYLSSQQQVEAGTPVFKIKEENIQEAKAELEEEVTEASLAYRLGLLTYEQSMINAKYDYDKAVLAGKQAEAVYQDALRTAEEKLQKQKDALADNEQKLKEYENANKDYYYKYHLDTYKASYEKNSEIYYAFLAEYGFSDAEVGSVTVNQNLGQSQSLGQGSLGQQTGMGTQPSTGQQGGSIVPPSSGLQSAVSNNSTEENRVIIREEDQEVSTRKIEADKSNTESGNNEITVRAGGNNQSNNKENDTERLRKQSILRQMKQNMQSSKTAYEKTWDTYEAAAKSATDQIQKMSLQVEISRNDVKQAQTDYELEVLEAETTYKKALAQADLVKRDYEAAIQKAEDELETLQEKEEKTKEAAENFEKLLGDGYFYTENSGTIMMVGVRKDTNLQKGSMVVAYRNQEDISITVSVSQKDIGKLTVGDSASVMISEAGAFQGRITYLNPISNSDSRTNITYEVMIELVDGDISNLKENMTATVMFETGEDGK